MNGPTWPTGRFSFLLGSGEIGVEASTSSVALCHFSKMVNLEKKLRTHRWDKDLWWRLGVHHEKTYSLEDGHEMRCGSREAHCSHGDCFDVCSGASQDVGQVPSRCLVRFFRTLLSTVVVAQLERQGCFSFRAGADLDQAERRMLPLRQATLPALCDPPHRPAPHVEGKTQNQTIEHKHT